MKQAAIPAFVLSGMTIVCATVLQAIGHPSSELWTVAFTLSGGAVGITIPSITSASTSSVAPSAPAVSTPIPAPATAAAAPAVTPAPATAAVSAIGSAQ